jgi:hypothetical protein
MPGACGGEDHAGWRPVLALWSLALVRMGKLAATLPAELPALQRAALLVPQPKNGGLRSVPAANKRPPN